MDRGPRGDREDKDNNNKMTETETKTKTKKKKKNYHNNIPTSRASLYDTAVERSQLPKEREHTNNGDKKRLK